LLNADPEDDLDDLDDVLSQFEPGQAPPPAPPPTATTKTGFTRPRNNTRVDARPTSIPGSGDANLGPFSEADEDALSSDFAKELALGMESLMREIAGEATAGKDAAEGASKGEGISEEERTKVLKAAWEAMLVEGMDANLGEGGIAGIAENGGKEKAAAAGGFQDKIKQAMDKLKESESKFQGSSGPGGAAPTPESLETLLQSLGDLGLGDGGGDEEKELAGFLETMMGQLMTKEVLYEPLKELSDSFPPYLEKPPAPISEEDMKRFHSQQVCVKKILAVFEKPDYDDNDPEDGKQIVDLMSEMQSYGSPPAEIMGPLPPGLDGMSQIPGMGEEGCVVA